MQDENTGEQRDTCVKRETQTCVHLQVYYVCSTCARDSHDDDNDEDNDDDDDEDDDDKCRLESEYHISFSLLSYKNG